MRLNEDRNPSLVAADMLFELIEYANFKPYNHEGNVGFVVPADVSLMSAAAHMTYSAGDSSDVVADLFGQAQSVQTAAGLVVYFPGVSFWL